MTKVQPYLKFVVAIFGAVVTTALVQFPDNSTVQTWGPIVVTVLTALGVYAVPNKDPHALHQQESVQPPGA
jgi:hypothetical protein